MSIKPYQRFSAALLLSLFCSSFAFGQSSIDPCSSKFRIESPALNGVEIGEPFVVSRIEGIVWNRVSGMQFADEVEVWFQICGTQASGKLLSARVSRTGRFRIRGVPEGTYRFRATANGWQPLMGTVIVSKKANPKARIEIALPLGV